MDVCMSTCDCRYEQKCRYHHPISQSASTKNVKLEKCQITGKVDPIFGSACSLLRRALELAWFNHHATYGIKFKDSLQSQSAFLVAFCLSLYPSFLVVYILEQLNLFVWVPSF